MREAKCVSKLVREDTHELCFVLEFIDSDAFP